MPVRAKFRCLEVTERFTRHEGDTALSQRSVRLAPVLYRKGSHDLCDENRSFWEATPSGEITMTITNTEAALQFEVGADYYVDFTKADG